MRNFFRVLGSGPPCVPKKVDVKATAEAKTVKLAGVDQPVFSGLDSFYCYTFRHEKSLPNWYRLIKRKQQTLNFRKLRLV
jgi:hypothetical protein